MEHFIAEYKADNEDLLSGVMEGSQKSVQSVGCVLPVALLVASLGAPQGSLVLDAPSPKGSLGGEESEGAAGAPQASSVLAGAEAERVNRAGHKSKQDTKVIYR